ncbi:MAG: ribosome maturation factor RimM [Bacteroidales bacterium]
MELEDTRKTGRILKTHGREGELLVHTDFDLPDTFTKVESIFIMIDGQVVPFFIESAIIKSSKTAAVKLEDIDTLEEAYELTGNEWHLEKKTFTSLFEASPKNADWLTGYTVIDQEGNIIGEIVNIENIPSNTLLMVKTQDNDFHRIPFNEEKLFYVDENKKIIKINIPEGLLDL